jgi:stress response protein YsnF
LSFTANNVTKGAFPMFDMMLQMQRLGMRAMTMYQPIASAFIDSTGASSSTGSSVMRHRTGATHDTNEEQIIGVGEEVLNVGTRMVPGKTTRVRRVVVQTPVQQDVTLHSETVVLERRRPLSTNGGDVLTEVTVEMSDFNEVPVVSKAVHLVEEVLLRKEVTTRVETIHDTVKRDKLEIEQPSQLSVVFNPTQKQEEHTRADEDQGDKQSVVPMQSEHKFGDQERS